MCIRDRPGGGVGAHAGTAVRLVATPAAGRTMPDLRGLSTRQARTWLAALGVDVRIDGTGVVRSQSPVSGAALPRTARLSAAAAAPRVPTSPSTSTDGGTR